MAQVRLDGVGKTYDGGVEAVHAVDLDIADGEFVVLVGPSGCGKSTTLRMIAGLEAITTGTIAIGERVVNDISAKDRDIAFVFQNYALYPHMSVEKNMAFGLQLRKTPKDEIQRRIANAAKLLGLSDYLHRKPKALSGGQRQRVALGRAIVRQPAVFLFDEPLSNLDAKLRVQMRVELKRLHESLGTTMIYVTHDQVEAMTMADRIVVMDGGRVQQVATPLELYRHPANRFVATFIGSPMMNLIPGEIRGGTFSATDAALSLPIDAPDGAADIGIRPEDLTPTEDGDIVMDVDVVEPMGSETHVHAHLGRHTLIAKVDGRAVPQPGSELRCTVDPAAVHVFDAATGEAVTRTRVEA